MGSGVRQISSPRVVLLRPESCQREKTEMEEMVQESVRDMGRKRSVVLETTGNGVEGVISSMEVAAKYLLLPSALNALGSGTLGGQVVQRCKVLSTGFRFRNHVHRPECMRGRGGE